MDKDLSIVKTSGNRSLNYPAILEKIRPIVATKLLVNFDMMFANSDDLFFDMATQACNNNEQNLFFESMRDLSTKRAIIKSCFQREINKHFKNPSISNTQNDFTKTGSFGEAAALALVDNDRLEKKIGFTNIITKARAEHSMSLLALNSRLDLLYQNITISQANSPLDPGQICQAFALAIECLNLDIKPLLIVIKQFERFVISEIDMLYEEINQLLIKEGLLADFKYGNNTKKPQDTFKASAELADQLKASANSLNNSNSHNTTNSQADKTADSSKNRQYQQIQQAAEATFRELKNLLNVLRQDGQYEDYYANNAGPVIQQDQLVTALTELEGDLRQKAFYATPGRPINLRKAVQHILVQKADAIGGHTHSVSTDDSDTIYLVEMLFSFILDEKNLPVQIQAQLSMLQIPILKIALIDKTIFHSHNHPVRRLLNRIAGTAIGWSEKNIDKDKFYQKIVSIVEQIREQQRPSTEFYATLCEDFEDFTNKIAQKSSLIEKRSCQEVMGNARFKQAASLVNERLGELLDGKQLPKVVIDLLTTEWREYLQFITLKTDADSPDAQAAWQFANDLIWSVHPHDDEKSTKRLAAIAPKLQNQLEGGLIKTSASKMDIEHHVDAITDLHTLILTGQYDTRVVETALYKHQPELPEELLEELPEALTAELSGDLSGELPGELPRELPRKLSDKLSAESIATNDSTAQQHIGEANKEQTSKKYSAVERQRLRHRRLAAEFLKKVEDLPVGAWLEFHLSNNNIVRCKLAAKVPATDTYVMVNRMGVKAVEIKRAALAYDMQRGKTIVLDNTPIFDRALSSITRRLRKVKTQSGEVV